jgi:hypothetical protein
MRAIPAVSAVIRTGVENAPPLPSKVLFGAAIAAGLWLVLPKAFAALRRLQPDMNLLMTVAVIGAIAIGEWLEAATVAFLFSLSLLLESWSVNRARRAVAALMDLSPPTARLIAPDGSTTEVAPTEVIVGAAFMVKPGERIPLDGQVKEGTSEVNQAPITGESVPVAKAVGSDVYAGTINGSLALDDLKLISRLKSDFPFRGIFQNRFRNRMIRILLQSGRSFDEFDLGMLIERDDLNHLRSSKRQRASLIESNCFEVRWRFEKHASFDEYALSSRRSQSGDDAYWRGNYQGAGTSNHQ